MQARMATGVKLAVALIIVLGAFSAPASAQLYADHTLTIQKVGNGMVTGSGISCGNDCSQLIQADCAYDSEIGEVVCDPPYTSVTASSANGFTFDHWGNCASSTATCGITLYDDETVVAYFNDVQNPTTTLTDPGTTAARGGTFALAATAADNGTLDRVEFYVRNVKVGQDTTPPYSLSFNSASVADGSALIESMAVDSAGRTSTRSGRTITIDNTNPTVSFTSGPNGQTFGPNTMQSFTFTAADATTGIASIQCKLDSGSFGACSGGTGAHSVSDLANGPHTLTVRATDGVGRIFDASRSWTIDATAPALTLDTPGAGVKRGDVTWSASASDANGVAKVVFKAAQFTIAEDTTAPYTGTWDTTQMTDGPVVVYAYAHDSFGNVSSTDLMLSVDNTKPSVEITGGPDGATFGPQSTQQWTFATSDATSGVAQVQCRVDDGAYAPCTAPTAHSVANAAGGQHTLTVRSTDAAGNEQTASRNWTIDATGPVVAIESGPSNGVTLAPGVSSVEFAFSANEPSSYQCRVYPAALTPPEFGDCSESAGHKATGFNPGTYAFEVVGADGFGNQGAAVKRTFTVADSTDTGTGTGTGTGTATGDGSTSSGSAPIGGVMASGSTSEPGRIVSGVNNKWAKNRRGWTLVKTLNVADVPVGATVTVSCKGKGCPYKKKAVTVKGAIANIKPAFKKRALKPRSVITISITKPGLIGKVVRYTTVRNDIPKTTVSALR